MSCRAPVQTMPLKLATGRGTAATCVAVVFAACKLERLPRTLKEILAVIPEADQKKASAEPHRQYGLRSLHRIHAACQRSLQKCGWRIPIAFSYSWSM